MIGRTLNDIYRVADLVGAGGFADVYLGRDLRTNTVAAVKILHAHFARDPKIVERFLREAKIAEVLDEPHVVRVLDSGRDGDTHYIVMEYVQGLTLADMVHRNGPMAVDEAVAYIRQVLLALGAAHRHGIIHRDIKPQNVMVVAGGQVKVMDFGIAKDVEASGGSQTTMYLGTPRYMSPEQANGAPASPRSDIYAVTITLYELLTGQPPFSANTPWQILNMQMTVAPPPITNFRSDVPVTIQQVLQKGLEKDPARRFQSAENMIDGLEHGVPLIGEPTVFGLPVAPADATIIANPPPTTSRGVVAEPSGNAVAAPPATGAAFVAPSPPVPLSGFGASPLPAKPPASATPAPLTSAPPRPPPGAPIAVPPPVPSVSSASSPGNGPVAAPPKAPSRRGLSLIKIAGIFVLVALAILVALYVIGVNIENQNAMATATAAASVHSNAAGAALSAGYQIAASTPTAVNEPSGTPTASASSGAPHGASVATLGPLPRVLTTVASSSAGLTWRVLVGAEGSALGQVKAPEGIAFDAQGDFYVADRDNNRIEKFSPDGKALLAWGVKGTGPADFDEPVDVAVDGQGNIYVVDRKNDRILKFSSDGQAIAQWGSQGSGPGQFNLPDGIALDSHGNVYVADTYNNRIQKLSPAGQPLEQWGKAGSGRGEFRLPEGVAVMANGDVVVADTGNNRVQWLSPAGKWIGGRDGSTDISAGQVWGPTRVKVDAEGQVFALCRRDDRIREFNGPKRLLGRWGKGGTAVGAFNDPQGLALDGKGDIYVADTGNNRIQVAKLP